MKYVNRAMSIAVSALVLVIGARSLPLAALSETAEETNSGNLAVSLQKISESYDSGIFKQAQWINLNGTMGKVTGNREMFSNKGVLVTDNGYVAGTYSMTTTDYEYDETIMLKEYLDRKGIQLLYVNEPLKYSDDEEMLKQFGRESYGNQNADKYLSRIGEAGIEYLDLREYIESENLDSWALFYRTDHHWTVPAGLWATTKIVDVLNADYGYQIDTTLYEDSNLNYTYVEDCWLGEQGRVIAESYIGLDDYTEIKPTYETDFSWSYWNAEPAGGSFDSLIDESRYYADVDVYSVGSWHYSYCPNGINGLSLVNNNVPDGRILYLGDSYDQVVVPFLALGVHEVDTLVLRAYDGSLLDYIEAGDYDTVIIAYAEFMIGAHDNEESANYAMFTFE
jgi:hypothetical protein